MFDRVIRHPRLLNAVEELLGEQAYCYQLAINCKAAFNGVEAALLARAGFTAPDDPLDGRRGLFALFGR